MKKNVLRRALSFLAVFTLMAGLLVKAPVVRTTVLAEGENAAVTEDKKGVLQVKVVYVDDSGNQYDVQSGTAFLINDTTAITANHVVYVDDETMQAIADTWGNGKTPDQCRAKLKIVINVLRDNTMTATVKTDSAQLDMAVLSLQQAINNRTYLPIRKSSEVQQTETCYALGFPAEFAPLETVQTFTSDDVTISNGQVAKLSTITTNTGTANYVVTNAKITSGFSGGPLVDANGNVIGVSKGATSENYFDQDYYYSVATDEIINILESWGIDYTSAGGAVAPAPTEETEVEPVATPEVISVDTSALQSAVSAAEALDLSGYTDASVSAYNQTLSDAKNVLNNANATQDQINSAVSALNEAKNALEKKSGISPIMIGGIAAALIAVVALIIVLINKGKNNKQTSYDDVPYQQPVAPAAPQYNEAPAAPQTPTYQGGAGTTVLGSSAGETTVLGGSAGETTVLNAKTYGTLVRKKNGERVSINKDRFRIGRERNNVDYCIADNSNVGRLHAEIISNGPNTYVLDKHSTNSTFVNDVRITSGQQVEIKDGDKIAFADEEFTYHQ